MKYEEFPPLPELADYIQLIWTLESETGDEVFPREQIMPDGIVEIIFHYADPFYTYQDGEKFLQPESFAISMMQKCVEIESSGKTGFVSVRFYPWGAYHFFSEPVQHFLDRTISTEQLWKAHYGEIMQAVRTAPGTAQKVQAVQQFLSARLGEHKKNNSAVDEVMKLIRHEKGLVSIEDICAKTGFSRKQLERKFMTSVGTTPKIFSRISRFLYICHNLKENNHKSLTQLAYDCGFYDQAHFIKEFKAFSGFTPKDFFARNNVVFSDL
ncbi:MAG: AraC family transcriptional regulator [Bacteroidetes bacterium]|nr:MAG: AraC family transcriptional regulator [Bacteroidota bacterium]